MCQMYVGTGSGSDGGAMCIQTHMLKKCALRRRVCIRYWPSVHFYHSTLYAAETVNHLRMLTPRKGEALVRGGITENNGTRPSTETGFVSRMSDYSTL